MPAFVGDRLPAQSPRPGGRRGRSRCPGARQGRLHRAPWQTGLGDDLADHAHNQLVDRGINIGRNYVGEYCTGLDMAGASLTLVRLDDEIESLLAEPAEVAIWVF